MPAPKKPTTFDAHLGTLLSDLSRMHGGRAFLAELLGVSTQTINRRSIGLLGYPVRDLLLVADVLNSTPELLVDQALRNYGNGSAELGLEKLRAEGETDAANVGAPHEDDFEVSPGDAKRSDHALAANKRPKKADTAPHAD